MARIHVLLKKEELDAERLSGKVVIVLDVLFATTSIATALAHGAREVIPAVDGASALAEAGLRPPGSYVLAGELNAVTLDGFAAPTPVALLQQRVADKTVIFSTTNGTVALSRASEAERVYAAAVVNAEAVVDHVCALGDRTVLIACAGSADRFNLEDFYGAGYLVSLFARRGVQEFTDAALAAQLLHERGDAYETLARSRVGQMMFQRGLEEEVRFAAQKSCFDAVPILEGGRIRRA